MVLMYLFPLSGPAAATLPHVLASSGYPAVPNPILESQLLQAFSLLPTKPILALEAPVELHTALKPSLLQLCCKEAFEPIRVFHVLRPSEVARYLPSAISEYRELACKLMTVNFVWPPILIPRQILEKGVFQYVGNLVSCISSPCSLASWEVKLVSVTPQFGIEVKCFLEIKN